MSKEILVVCHRARYLYDFFHIYINENPLTDQQNIKFKFQNIEIYSDEEEKQLTINLNFMLYLKICRQASWQMNNLKRIGSHLNRLVKLTI